MQSQQCFGLHLFVCSNGKTCPKQNAGELLSHLKGEVHSSGLRDLIRVNKSGCLGQCGHGPMLVIYPQGIWLHALESDDYAVLSELLKDRKCDLQYEDIANSKLKAKLYQPQSAGVNICTPGEEKVAPASTD